MRKSAYFLFVFSCVLFAGCAPSGTWSHPQKRAQQFAPDDMQCAQYASQVGASVPSTVISFIFQRRAYSSCMRSLGWAKDAAQKEAKIAQSLNEEEKAILGSWLTQIVSEDGDTHSASFNYSADKSFLITIANETKGIVTSTMPGRWTIHGDNIITMVFDQSATEDGQDSVQVFKLNEVDDTRITLTNSDSGSYFDLSRLGPKEGFKSSAVLIPNITRHNHSNNYGSSSIRENHYGYGIHADQYGRAIKTVPY